MSLLTDPSPLVRALAERGYSELTPVQNEAVSDRARGHDLLVSAQTGSGKTVAYGLAIGETLLNGAEVLDRAGQPLALIVAPTRELALQVERELVWLFAGARGRVVACVGGMDARAERRRLELGAHIVVGTPGRLRDHIDRRALDVSALKAVVLDEADEMLDLGFREDLEAILEATPPERRTLLFSATLPDAIVSIARRFQRDAVRIETAGPVRAHADIEHRAIRISPREIGSVVVNVLRKYDAPAAIVFCSTREAVRRLHATLAERGFSAVPMSGELGQNERNRALQDLRDGRARVCVATDVAARGIDLPNLTLVIHADLPHDAEVFQHRSGRTGRAGRKGVSVLLAPAARRRKAELLLNDLGVAATWEAPPTPAEIDALDQERLFADPALTAEPTDAEAELARTLAARMSPEQIALALARLHRSRLPAAETVEDPIERFAPRDRGDRNDRGPHPERGVAVAFETTAQSHKREPMGESTWFRLAIGRKQNADPKWLLPMLCRRGQITRQEIGAIRIFDTETKVQISAAAAEGFAVNALGSEKGDVAITRADDGPGRPAQAPQTPRPERHERSERQERHVRPERHERPAAPHGKSWSPHAPAEPVRAERATPRGKPAAQRPAHGAGPQNPKRATDGDRARRPQGPAPHGAKRSGPGGPKPKWKRAGPSGQ